MDANDALFLLVRHGVTICNETDCYRGQSDDASTALTKKGVKQAKVAGRFISRLPVKIGIIYCSDLERTKHSAALIASILGIQHIHTDPRLLPLDVGDFTGESKEDNSIDEYLANPEEPFPNGESVDTFRKRQEDFADDLMVWIKNHPTEKPLVVGHLSNVVYFADLEKSLPGYLKEYSSNKEDLINPGGIVAVMPDDKVVPLLGENKNRKEDDKL